VRSVGEYFIKYLLSRPGTTLDDAKAIAESLEIPTLTDQYIGRLKETLLPYPDDYNPEDLTHFPTVRWLKQHKIRDMWRRTPEVQRAYEIINSPSVREIIEAAIVSPLPPREFLDDLFYDYSDMDIRVYQHYFFNVGLLESSQLRELIVRRGGLRQITYEGDVDQDLAKSVFNYKRGSATFSLPMGRLSKKLMDIAAIKVLQLARTAPSKTDATMVQKYTQSIQQSQDILAKSGAAAEDLIDLFEQLTVSAREDAKLISYKQLTGREPIKEGPGEDEQSDEEGAA
jgi:hypothetical protein